MPEDYVCRLVSGGCLMKDIAQALHKVYACHLLQVTSIPWIYIFLAYFFLLGILGNQSLHVSSYGYTPYVGWDNLLKHTFFN